MAVSLGDAKSCYSGVDGMYALNVVGVSEEPLSFLRLSGQKVAGKVYHPSAERETKEIGPSSIMLSSHKPAASSASLGLASGDALRQNVVAPAKVDHI